MELIVKFKPSGANPFKPPLSIAATVHLAWGMTLTLSHEKEQSEVGKTFIDRFSKLWEQYKGDKVALEYLDNLSCILASCLRQLGWQRDTYTRYLDAQEKVCEERIKNANDLAEQSSCQAIGSPGRWFWASPLERSEPDYCQYCPVSPRAFVRS